MNLRVDTQWKRIEDTDVKLPPKHDLYVDSQSYAEISFGHNETLKINEKSAFSLNASNVDTTTIDLELGSVKLNIPSEDQDTRNYKLKNPVSTIGVRGTVFSVSHELQNQSEILVNSGIVRIKTPSQTFLTREKKYVLAEYRANTGKTRIEAQKEIPGVKKLVWKHWQRNRKVSRLQRKIRRIRAKLNDIQRRINLPGVPEGIKEKLRSKRKQLDRLLTVKVNQEDEQKQLLKEIQEAYFAYREEILYEKKKYRRNQLKQFLGEGYYSDSKEEYKQKSGEKNKNDQLPYRRDSEPEEYPDF